MIHFIGARPISRSSRVLVFHSIVSHFTLGTTCGAWRSALAVERVTFGVIKREEAGIIAAQRLQARYPEFLVTQNFRVLLRILSFGQSAWNLLRRVEPFGLGISLVL